jgi:hypothetical protein
MGRAKSGSTKKRWDVAIKDKAFDQIRYLVLPGYPIDATDRKL